MILENMASGDSFQIPVRMNSNLNQILMKANAFYSHYKSKILHQYKNKCMAA
jgi:hypothetical protein